MDFVNLIFKLFHYIYMDRTSEIISGNDIFKLT